MTTQTYGSRGDERPGSRAGGAVPAQRSTSSLAPAPPDPASSVVRLEGWTPAHTEVARFVGESFAVGAVLGLVVELTRPVWEKHRA